jgi:hypothetical protein
MLSKKWISVVVLVGAAMSTTAFADDRGINTAIGAVVGAAIGNSFHGTDGAIVGGVIGAAVGASTGGYRETGYVSAPRYDDRPVVVAQPARYYQPAPVYVAPRPVYVASYDRDHERYRHYDNYRNGYRRDYDRRDDDRHYDGRRVNDFQMRRY